MGQENKDVRLIGWRKHIMIAIHFRRGYTYLNSDKEKKESMYYCAKHLHTHWNVFFLYTQSYLILFHTLFFVSFE